MTTAIVVDDEWAVGQWLGLQLRESQQLHVQHILQNPFEVMEYVQQYKTDVVFLDIDMPGMTGIEVAEQLSGLEHPPEVVFVTAYNSYAIDAFRVNALDYVMKPIRDIELSRVLQKVIKRVNVKRIYDNHAEKTIIANPLFNLQYSTAKSEELLLYLLLNGMQLISKWKLIENLWPEKDPDKGESNLRTTVFRLNQTLHDAGMNARVKAVKGYYQLLQNEGPIALALFPPNETIHVDSRSLLEFLKQYNLIPLLEDKDYLWIAGIKRSYEEDYYQWSICTVEKYKADKKTYLQVIKYLMEIYIWKEQLILAAMPLLLELEGKGSLVFFHNKFEQIWNEWFEVSFSEAINEEYHRLVDTCR